MALEYLVWPIFPPQQTDLVDSGESYNLGIRFHVLVDTPCAGVRWRVPDTIADPPGAGGFHIASLWSVVGETRLAFKPFTPVPGGNMDIMFDLPVILTAGTEYVIAVYTRHYVFSSPGAPSGTWQVMSTSGNVIADQSRLMAGGNPLAFPANNFNGWYYIDPITGTETPPDSPDVLRASVTAMLTDHVTVYADRGNVVYTNDSHVAVELGVI